jgi:peptidoglycan/LPS O-acetylase OafA/YrhL
MGIIRFALAIVVVLGHVGYGAQTIGGLASVQAFFVLSGIYMAAVYRSKYGAMPNGALTFFYNRALRLWPTYLLLLVLTLVAYIAFGRPQSGDMEIFRLFRSIEQEGITQMNGLMLFLSVVLFGQDVASVVEPMHLMLPVRQSWSIASELLFYLSVPFLARNARWKLLLGSFVLLMALKYALLVGVDWRYSYFLPFGNFGYFALGFGLFHLFLEPGPEAIRSKVARFRPLILGCTVLALYLFGEASFERGELVRHFVFIGCFSAAAILLFEKATNRLDILLGNVSYGIYLNHFLVLAVGNLLGLPGIQLLIFTLAGSLALGFMVEKYVQKPIDTYRYRQAVLQ